MKNTYLSLARNSAVRLDSRNIIKYTLLLDYAPPKVDSAGQLNEQFIRTLMIHCQKCCRGLFTNPNSSYIQYDFFGTPKSSYPLPNNSNDFFINLDTGHDQMRDNKVNSNVGFHTMLLHHCIMSSYHAILTDLLHNQYVSSYEIVNKIGKNGMYSLYKMKKLIPQKDGLRFNDSSNKKHSSSKASDFQKLVKAHFNKLPNLMYLMAEKASDTSDAYHYPLQFSNLCRHICQINASAFNIFVPRSNKKTKKDYQFFNKLKDITEQLEPRVLPSQNLINESLSSSRMDRLYHYYLTERFFNTNLFYHLLKNILLTERNTSYQLCQKDILTVLACCKDLPNVFSREYFLRYAFVQFSSNPRSYSDFWRAQELSLDRSPFTSSRGIPENFQFPKWLEQYPLFVNYMAKFVIPIYEWCFLNMLLESIEDIDSKTQDKDPEASHVKHLTMAMEALADYVDKNYEKMLCIAKLPSSEEDFSIITEHRNILELDVLPDESVLQLKNIFFDFQNIGFPDTDRELNLTPLNPAFFKNDTEPLDPNTRRIRKFYIDLIRYTHLN